MTRFADIRREFRLRFRRDHVPSPARPPTSPSGTTTSFPPPTGAQMVRALRAPAIGYAWLLLGAVVTMVLIVVAANVGSTGAETGVESDDTNAIGVLIGMPFQIAGDGAARLAALHRRTASAPRCSCRR